jgi:UDP-glucose 4-epimerase
VKTTSAVDLAGSRAVVTGGLGFIGSNLVHTLVGANVHVAVIDALVPDHGGSRCNLNGLEVEVMEADIADPLVADLVRDADIVFNVAGQVNHLASMRDPLGDLHLNAMCHASFLETLRVVNPTARVVHTSTRQVYGRASTFPVTETHHAQPVDINGVAKWAGEQLHLVHHRAYGLPATALRLTNIYGPRQRLTSNELGVLPVFVRRALLDETIQIYGDGQQRRDVLYVDDVVDALIASTCDAAVGQVLNVGAPDDFSLIEIANTIVAAAGGTNHPVLTPWPSEHRAIDIGSFHTDGTKIHDLTGWAARVSLEQGVAETIAFYREHPWYLSST